MEKIKKTVVNDNEIKVRECNNFISRLRGFMFYKKKIDYALLFNKCNSIHTFFCFQNLDIIMCDKDDNVLYYYENFKPWKIILPKKNVKKVYEFKANSELKNIKKLTILP